MECFLHSLTSAVCFNSNAFARVCDFIIVTIVAIVASPGPSSERCEDWFAKDLAKLCPVLQQPPTHHRLQGRIWNSSSAQFSTRFLGTSSHLQGIEIFPSDCAQQDQALLLIVLHLTPGKQTSAADLWLSLRRLRFKALKSHITSSTIGIMRGTLRPGCTGPSNFAPLASWFRVPFFPLTLQNNQYFATSFPQLLCSV